MSKKRDASILQKVQSDYNEIAKEFDLSRNHAWAEFENFLPYIKDGDFVADIGCGNGRFYDFASREKKIKYIGVDNSIKLLEAARKNHPEVQFIEGELQNIPIEDKRISLVVEIASFHHLPSRDLRNQALSEVNRILKDDGTFIITVWNLFQPKYKKYIWKARLKSLFTSYAPRDTFIPWGKSGIDRYYYAFTEKEMRKLLESNGLKVIKMYTGNNLIFICRKK